MDTSHIYFFPPFLFFSFVSLRTKGNETLFLVLIFLYLIENVHMFHKRNKWTNIFYGMCLRKMIYVYEKLKTSNVVIEKIYYLDSLCATHKKYIIKQRKV